MCRQRQGGVTVLSRNCPRYIEPTILLNPPLESAIMTEEIFGPLLPIITVKPVAGGGGAFNFAPVSGR